MENFIRHFVSKRLGRASVEVIVASANEGVVTITPDSSVAPCHFSFHLADATEQFGDGAGWLESVARIAISQLQKEITKSKTSILTGGTRPLAASFHPWIGDLLSSPYGGATLGIDERRQAGLKAPGPHG